MSAIRTMQLPNNGETSPSRLGSSIEHARSSTRLESTRIESNRSFLFEKSSRTRQIPCSTRFLPLFDRYLIDVRLDRTRESRASSRKVLFDARLELDSTRLDSHLWE